MANPIGKTFVEVDLDAKKYNKGIIAVKTTSKKKLSEIEKAWKGLGKKSEKTYDDMRAAVNKNYDKIKKHSLSTANDIYRAEKAKNDKISRINKQQFGEQKSLLDTAKKHWMAFSAAAIAAIYAIGRVLKESISAFADWETALVDMAKVSDESFGSITETIRSIDPALGSSTELVKGYYQVMSAGVTNPKKALDLLTVAAKMGKSAHTDSSEVIKGLTAVMAGYEGKVKTATEAADLLYTIEAKGKVEVKELIPLIGGLAAMSEDLGITQDELGAAFAQVSLTAGGTSAAATQYQSILTALMKPTTAMKNALATMSREGMEPNIQPTKDVKDAMELLKGELEKDVQPTKDVKDAMELLKGAFQEGVKPTGAIKDAMELLKKQFEEGEQPTGKMKDAMELLEKALKNQINPMNSVKGEMEGVGFESAQAAIKALGFKKVLERLTESTGGSAQKMSDLFSRVEATKGMSGLASKEFENFIKIIEAMENKTGAADRAWEAYKKTLKAVWDTFKNTVKNQYILIGEELAPAVIKVVTAVTTWLEKNQEFITQQVSIYYDAAATSLNAIADALKAISEAWLGAMDYFVGSDTEAQTLRDRIAGAEKIIELLKIQIEIADDGIKKTAGVAGAVQMWEVTVTKLNKEIAKQETIIKASYDALRKLALEGKKDDTEKQTKKTTEEVEKLKKTIDLAAKATALADKESALWATNFKTGMEGSRTVAKAMFGEIETANTGLFDLMETEQDQWATNFKTGMEGSRTVAKGMLGEVGQVTTGLFGLMEGEQDQWGTSFKTTMEGSRTVAKAMFGEIETANTGLFDLMETNLSTHKQSWDTVSQEQLDAAIRMYEDLGDEGADYWKVRKALLNIQLAAYKQQFKDIQGAEALLFAWEAAELAKLDADKKQSQGDFVAGWKQAYADDKKEQQSWYDFSYQLYEDLDKAWGTAVDDMVDAFIAGEDLKTAAAEATGTMLKNIAADYAKKMFKAAIDWIIKLVIAHVAALFAGAGSKGATVGGSAGAATEIGLAAGVVAGAMTKAAGTTWKSGGWIAEHPSGGMLTGGSGIKDDVLLGYTPGIRHLGIGGEYVINKESTAKHKMLLDLINKDKGMLTGGYINKGYAQAGPIIPWEPTADNLIIGSSASFLHGMYKTGGPWGGLVELMIFLIGGIGAMFAEKLITAIMLQAFSSEGGMIDIGHGFGGWWDEIKSVDPILKRTEKWLDLPFDTFPWLKDIPYLGDRLADVRNWVGTRLSWGQQWLDPEKAWKAILELLRTPLEGVSKDLVTPDIYYPGLESAFNPVRDYFEEQLKPELDLLKGVFDFKEGGVLPHTGLFHGHKGEKVIPEGKTSSGGDVIINSPLVHIGGNLIADKQVFNDFLEDIEYGLAKRAKRVYA